MTNDIRHSYFFSHPPAIVWEYLTKSELMAQWLMPNDFLPIVGYDFEFQIKPVPALDFDGIVYCKVLDIIPYKKLTYSWKSGPGDKKITLDSIVYWTLIPKDEGTELLLEHTGFTEHVISLRSAMNEGWQKNIQKITHFIHSTYGETNN